MSEIKIGDYVIMNDADKPCTRLIAVVTQVDAEKERVNARYICERVNMREPYGWLGGVTLVSDFGVEMTFNGDTVSTEQLRPSVATYRDGKLREWQPSGENPEQKLFRGKKKAATGT